jgi:hypothetical protein
VLCEELLDFHRIIKLKGMWCFGNMAFEKA